MNPLDKLKKLKNRSWTEIRSRGEQAFSVYAEQIGLSGRLPTDDELHELLNKSVFGKGRITADIVFDRFFEIAHEKFFPAFGNTDETVEVFRRKFKGKPLTQTLDRAERIIEGRFDLLGYTNLDFGTPIDWHFEPLSGKRLPLKHWKQFDELDTAETGDKKVIWELNRHQHFFTLGLAYRLTKEERFAAAFARQIESWMEQNPPGMGINWFSSLEVAFRAISWIWAFHFFKGSQSLTPELFQKILKYLYLHGRHIEKYLSVYYSPNTHLTGEGLGLYYLGTQLEIFERASTWRALGEEILLSELDRQIYDDGVYFEQSTWYARYTADFYTHFLILKNFDAEKADKAAQEKLETKLQLLYDFLMYAMRPDGTTPLIGDDDGGRSLPLSAAAANDFRGALSTAAIVFGRGAYKFAAGELREETLWLLGAEGAKSFDNLSAREPHQTSRFFAEGGYFAMRDGWAATDNYLLVDGGALGALSGGHGHADALAFEAAIGGQTLLVDSGTYTYHESEAMRDYFRSSIAHNTLMIDGKSQSETGGKFAWQTRAETRVKTIISEERFDFFEASHDGYERLERAATHERSILFLKNDYWIMRDFVRTHGTHDYALNFHFNHDAEAEIEPSESGLSCVGGAPRDKDGWRLFTFGDNGDWQKKESWISECYGRKANAPFLRFVSKGAGAQEFFTFLLPANASAAAPEVLEANAAEGRAFVIKYGDYTDFFVFADSAEQVVRTELFNTNFRFFWARMSAGESVPEEFVMVAGTHFSLGSREIINYPNELKFAVARRLGNRLNVRTSENLFSVSLPQRNSTSYILKNSLESED
jgi:hypothetical protein